MKKTLTIILVVSMIMTFMACNKKNVSLPAKSDIETAVEKEYGMEFVFDSKEVSSDESRGEWIFISEDGTLEVTVTWNANNPEKYFFDDRLIKSTDNTIPEIISEPNSDIESQNTPFRDGDYIVFGHYEQDGDLSNGPEPIEWEVVKEKDGRMLLVSRYILDCQPYNMEFSDITWETCSLRSWLNNEFINSAFTMSEQVKILTVTNSNPDNAYYGTAGGKTTDDKVFCLSVKEIMDNYEFEERDEEYDGGVSQALKTEVTSYAANKKTYVADNNCGYWWLRSPGEDSSSACFVLGSFGGMGWGCLMNVDDFSMGVRPAIYLSASEIPNIIPVVTDPVDITYLVTGVSASSEDDESYGNYYYAENIIDDDLDTSWAEGLDDDGIGEYITFYIPEGTLISGLIVHTGYCKSENVFYKNGAPSVIDVYSGTDGYRVYLNTADTNYSASDFYAALEGVYITFPSVIVSNGELKISIVKVRSGESWSDTNMSEIVIMGAPAPD